MAVGGLFALFDDIALLMKKAAGVTGDDFAVSAGQCHGLPPHREIPVLWRITKGSLLNKAILVGLLLLIDYFMPVLALVLLVSGACYIAFEAGEKVVGWMGLGEHEEAHETSPKTEEELVKGALRTDMVLSAEIMIISLAAAGEASFEYKALLLVLVGFFVTLIIYGIVTLLVRLDDMGFALMRSPTAFVQHIGKGMTHAAPKIMEALGVGGTIAIFMVAGGIFRHTLPFVHEYSAFLHVLPEIFADIAVGFVISLVLVGFIQIGHLVQGKKS
jgi:predicted DNA repair protein MutK